MRITLRDTLPCINPYDCLLRIPPQHSVGHLLCTDMSPHHRSAILLLLLGAFAGSIGTYLYFSAPPAQARKMSATAAIGDREAQQSPDNDDQQSALLNAPETYPIQKAPLPPVRDDVALLGDLPQWEKLRAYASTRTADEILSEIQSVYAVSDIWQQYLRVADDTLSVLTDTGDWLDISLAASVADKIPAPVFWDVAVDPTSRLPLAGLNIGIDPGHIGGSWATIEERIFRIGSGIPIREGDMTLRVAWHLKKNLEDLGAVVTLIRRETEPVTTYRPADFTDYVRQRFQSDPSGPLAQKQRELLFYRTAEIRARARYANVLLQPDIVLCLHFNAESWGDPDNPSLLDDEHFHMLVNGAYTDGEWAAHDVRYELVERLLSNTHRYERDLSQSIATAMRLAEPMRPYRYAENSRRALPISTDGYVWARNLIANRLYKCPVIYFEPYLMNGRDTYQRVQAGDYNGLRLINGRLRPSIYRAYAENAALGILQYFQAR